MRTKTTLMGLWIAGALSAGAAAACSSGDSNSGSGGDAGAGADSPSGDASHGDASAGDASAKDGSAGDASHGDASTKDAAHDTGSDGSDSGGSDASEGGKDGGSDGPQCLSGAVMVCGWGGANGTICAVSDGVATFGASSVWESGFNTVSNGELATVQYPDVNGDGLADFCGWDGNGIHCAISNGSTFGALGTWSSDFALLNDADQDYLTIRYPDIDGDGKADVCGRSIDGIECAISNGIAFGQMNTWDGDYSDAAGWNGATYEFTIQYPDINGDGKADVCGRGQFGIDCALSSGAGFTGFGIWQGDFSDQGGWGNDPSYWMTIQFADISGDGMADVCGRGQFGLDCALSNGSSFGALGIWQGDLTDQGGWNNVLYYPSVQLPDVNGDGKADVCARGQFGIDCALSNGSGFGALGIWQGDYADANGWSSSSSYYATVQFPDVNGDGKADVCGRSGLGIACALSSGSSFGASASWQGDFSDANGWNAAPLYQSIQFPIASKGNCKPAILPTPQLSPDRRFSF